MSIKISVIMPSLNVRKYIKQCIKSVMNQTLKNIEIICVDAGSDDGTLEVLNEAAAEDSRIKIINSPVKSYGYQMNLGLKAAQGEYISIIETDDWAEPEMLETLYNTARAEDLDVIKSDFYFYWSKPKEKNVLYKLPKVFINAGVISPLANFENFIDQAEFFNIKPSIWSAVYKKSFLDENKIDFNETPGASFQDAGFNFKVWACAKRARLIKDAFIHYRQDNEASSVKSSSKVYCVCDEHREMDRFIEEKFTGRTKTMAYGIKEVLKFDNYMWNYGRLSQNAGNDFLRKVSCEFRADLESGRAQKQYFPDFKWNMLNLWAEDPESFIAECERSGRLSLAERIIRKIKRSI